MTETTTKPYKQADAVFFLMKRLGFDPIKDVRQQYELEQALDRAHNAAIDRAHQQIHPSNPESDWTEYAKDTARAASRLMELKK